MSDDLKDRAWFVVQLFRECDAIQLPHRPTEEVLLGMIARIEALEAEIDRLHHLIPRPDQTEDELVWRDHMRGVPLAALAKEFGITKERMRHRLKRIAENKLHLTGDRGASGG